MVQSLRAMLFLLVFLFISCNAPEKELSVLQFNIWQEGNRGRKWF